MLTIRLHRIGKRNQPSFRIVVADKRFSAAAGKFREEVGFVNRVGKEIKIDKEKIVYWMQKGAQPSPAVKNILIDQKIVEGKKTALHCQPKKKEGADAPKTEAAPAQA
jgi:ribosomal protein S16